MDTLGGLLETRRSEEPHSHGTPGLARDQPSPFCYSLLVLILKGHQTMEGREATPDESAADFIKERAELLQERKKLETILQHKQEEIETLKEGCDHLRRRFQSQIPTVQEIQVTEVNENNQDDQSTKEEHLVLQAEIADLKKQVDNFVAIHQQQVENLTEKQEDITEKEKEIKCLQSKITELEEQNKSKETAIGMMDDNLTEKQREVTEKETIISHTKEEVERLKTKINALEEQNKHKDTAIAMNDGNLKEKDGAIKVKEAIIAQKKEKIKSLKTKVALIASLQEEEGVKFTHRAKELETSLSEKGEEIGKLMKEMSRLNVDISNLEGLCEDRTRKCDDQAEQIKRTEEELKKKEEELMKKKEEFERKEIDTVQQYSEEAKQKKIKYEQEIAMKNETIENCEKEIKGLKDDVSNLQRMCQDSSRKCDDQASVIKYKEKELEQKEKDLREMKDKHDEEIRRMSDATENIERDHSVLQADLDGMTKQLEYIAAKYPQQEENLTEQQEEITEKEQEIKDLKMKIAEMEGESKQREARLGQTNDTMTENEEALAEREREVARLQEEFKQQERNISEKEVLIASLNKESDTLTLKNKQLDASLREKREEIGKLREELESSQKWCQSLKSINQELQMKESGENVMKESRQQNPHTEPFENFQQYQKDHEKLFKEKQSCDLENVTLKAEINRLETKSKDLQIQNEEFKVDIAELANDKVSLQQVNQRLLGQRPNMQPVATTDQSGQPEKSSTTWYAPLEKSVEVGEEADDFVYVPRMLAKGTQTDAKHGLGELEKALGQERANKLTGGGAMAKIGDTLQRSQSHPPIKKTLLPGHVQQVIDNANQQGDGNLRKKSEGQERMEVDEKKFQQELLDKLIIKDQEIAELQHDNNHLKSFRSSALCVQQWLQDHRVFNVVVAFDWRMKEHVREQARNVVKMMSTDRLPMSLLFLSKRMVIKEHYDYGGRFLVPVISTDYRDVTAAVRMANLKEHHAVIVMFNYLPHHNVKLPTTEPLHPAVYIRLDMDHKIMDTEDNQKALQRMREALVEKVEISYDALSTLITRNDSMVNSSKKKDKDKDVKKQF